MSNRATCMLEARTGKRCPTCADRMRGGDDCADCEWFDTLSDVEPMTLGEAREQIREREATVTLREALEEVAGS